MTATFSASGEEAIKHSIDLNSCPSAQRPKCSDILEFFEIERTAKEIRDGGYKRIALQFPDELLHESVPIYRLLKQRVDEGQEMYVLADTSYGSCCVDEVAAQHVDADAMVHYGHACLSQTSRLPVIYVFGRKPIDVDSCAKQVVDVIVSNDESVSSVLIRHDVAYSYRAGEIIKELRDRTAATATRIVYHGVPTQMEPSPARSKSDSSPTPEKHEDNDTLRTESSADLVEDDGVIIYIGDESLTLTNILMTHSSNKVYSYNPATNIVRLESGRTNKLLMRRFAAVQKARDADVFGILVGTLGVASYLSVITYLRNLLSRATKKSYTISVGKLNPAKLANFMEIECFVLAACPENSLIESKDFFKPIITPHELKVALLPEGTWLGRYILNFDHLIAENECQSSEFSANQTTTMKEAVKDGTEDADADSDRPSFSLITGKYRQARQFGVEEDKADVSDSGDASAVVIRNQETSVAKLSDSAAALFLQSRTYRGLDARVGKDTPSVLEHGRSGIARGYTDELPPTDT
ncbi:putative diphthamide synthesis protein-domain-containing protein [Pisolithus marmoratus]|nr:putative diphthamide synthesis protein-domain-containing protein [Pisolithus marmoratus]